MSGPKRRLSNGSGCLLKICEDENSDDEGSIISNQEKSLYTFPKRQNNRRRSSIGGLNSKVPINPVEQARIAEMYKTVIQMSSENKLTEKNSWNYDLIDHMGKLIKDDNRAVNFQKASCTLDASVKIYSNRVDDTYSSSHRILESLSRNGTIHNSNDGDDNDETPEDGTEDTNGKRKLGSRSTRLQFAQTIEKNVSSLNAVKLENDIAVDPMFHKISKAFDEGGAKGMLMNNLRITPSTSSLSFYFPDTLPETTEVMNNIDVGAIDLSDLLRRADIPISELSSLSICPALDMYRDQICITCDASAMEMITNLCPSSSGAMSSLSQCDILSDEQEVNIEMDDDHIDDYFEDNNEDNYISNYQEEDAYPIQSHPTHSSQDSEEVHEATKLRWADASDNANQSTKSSSFTADLELLAEGLDKISQSGPSEYSYFDMNAMFTCNNAWAGAKHWKYATRKKTSTTSETTKDTVMTSKDSIEDNNTASQEPIVKSKTKKSTKARNENIDYNSISPILCDDSMFDYIDTVKISNNKNDPTLQTTAALAKLETNESISMLLLPPDAKVQVKDLCRLFLAPNVIIPSNPQQLASLMNTATTRQQRSGSSKIDKFLGCQSGSERIWGIQTSTSTVSVLASNGDTYLTSDTTMNQNDNDDDYYDDDEGGYDGGFDPSPSINNNIENLENDFLGLNINQNQLVQADRKVEKIEIGYAKVSKRVNIQRLKTDIWSNLHQNLYHNDEEVESEENISPNKMNQQSLSKNNLLKQQQQQQPSLSFQKLIYDISSETNEIRQKDVTLPFYFICLLHLANEHNLKIEDCVEMNELSISMGTK